MNSYRLISQRVLSCLIFLCCFSVNASATSLIEVFQAALENDPQWQADQATAASEIAQSKTARAGLLPDIAARASWQRVDPGSEGIFGFSESSIDTQGIQFRQPLFRLDKWNEYKASKQDVLATQQNLLVDQAQLINRVTRTYFDTLKAKLQENVARSVHKEARLQSQAQQLRQELGMVTPADVDRAQANAYQANSNVKLASSNFFLQLDYLMQLTDMPFVVLKPLVGIDVDGYDLDTLEALTTRMYAQNAQLASLRYSKQSAELTTKRIRALFAPQVDFVAQYANSETAYELSQLGVDFAIDGEQTTYGVEVNWPIFQGGAKFAQLEAAKLQNQALDAQYVQIGYQLERDLAGLWYQFQQSKTILQSRLYAQRAAEQMLARMQLSLELGDVSPIEVASAKAALRAEQQQVLIAKLDTITQWLGVKLLLAEVSEQTILQIHNTLVFAN